MRIDEARHLGIRVGLALHDMTPVAGEVAAGDEQRLALAPGTLHRLAVADVVPVHRVVAVHGQVG